MKPNKQTQQHYQKGRNPGSGQSVKGDILTCSKGGRGDLNFWSAGGGPRRERAQSKLSATYMYSLKTLAKERFLSQV